MALTTHPLLAPGLSMVRALLLFHSRLCVIVMYVGVLYLVTTAFKPTLGLTQTSVEWVSDFLSPVAKWPESEAGHILHLMPRLRMKEVTHASQPTFMAHTGPVCLYLVCLRMNRCMSIQHIKIVNCNIKTSVNKTLNC